MFEFIDIARREERRALSIADVADDHVEICGGVASRGPAGLWVNSAVAMGLSGPVAAQEIERLIAWHEQVGAEPRAEICPFVDPSLTRALAAAGFVLRSFENVLFREVRPDEAVRPPQTPPRELQIRVIDPCDAAAVREFGETVATGFAPDGQPASAESIELTARCVRHPRTVAIGAFQDGRCVGGGCFEQLDELAALWGLSVLPAYRRRGVQQALLAARLNLAAERGARVATISGAPAMGTERNVRRFGFQLAYTKAILVRPGQGLTPVVV